MPLALLFHYLMLNMFRMLIHPSSGALNNEIIKQVASSWSLFIQLSNDHGPINIKYKLHFEHILLKCEL